MSFENLCNETRKVSESIVENMFWVCVDVSIPTHLSEQIRHTSLMHSGNFSQGTTIPYFTCSSTKVVFCLCRKSLFLQLAASTGETEEILHRSLRNTLTKQTTNSEHGYRNAEMSVFFFLPSLFQLHLVLYVSVCHHVLGIFCRYVWVLSSFPWILIGNTEPGNISIAVPRLQDIES